LSKVLNSPLDDSNITLKSPPSEQPSAAIVLEQRVQEFNKLAKQMIYKLELTKVKIEQCHESEA